MAIDPIKLDNPLKRGQVPAEPMSIGFVPRGIPLDFNFSDIQSYPRLLLNYFGLVLAFAMLIFIFEYKSNIIQQFLQSQEKLFLAVFVGAIAARIFLPFRIINNIATPLAASIAGFSVGLSAATSNGANRHLVLAFLTAASAWLLAEFAIHYESIQRKIVSLKSPQQHEGSLTLLIALATIGTIGLCASMLHGLGWPCLLCFAAVYFWFAYEVAKVKCKKPLIFIIYSVRSYYEYPNAKECAPGLIQSACGSRSIRPMSLLVLVYAYALLSFFFSPRPLSVSSILVWQLASLACALGFVAMIGALAAEFKHLANAEVDFPAITQTLRASSNSHEKKSYFWGLVESDFSPIVINRDLLFQHCHILGTTGSGKSVRLAPLIEQTIGFGDMSLVVIDLKADKLEALASCIAARDELLKRTEVELPIKIFTINLGEASHAFNPFRTTGWRDLSIPDRTSVLAESLNLHYGTDWSRGHFSAVNADIIHECLMANPEVGSFAEFYQTLCRLASDGSTNIGSQRRQDYVHVAQSFQKLATCSVLNSPTDRNTESNLEQQINLANAFQSPGIYYFNLPSTTSPFVAQTVARLVTKFLLVAAKSVERTTKVQVIIDEFQRMVSENLDGLFQMARSHDISLVIANQSLGDLRSAGDKLIQAIEGNCAIRQWLSVNSVSDIELVSKLFGTHKELFVTVTDSGDGQAIARSWRDAPRITTTNLHQISDDPSLSITQITGARSGYALYGGVPFIARNSFHISKDEYQRRQKFAWPSDWPGLIEVCDLPVPSVSKRKKNRRDTDRRPEDKHEDTDYDQLFD